MGKCRLGTLLRRAGPPLQAAVRMKPGYLLFALLLTGLAAQEDDDEARKGAGVKGACKNTGPKPNPKIFAKYTIPIKNKKCPCWWDLSKNDCAWCAPGGFQCYADGTTGPDSKDGSRCQDQKNQKYCTSVQGDCRHIPRACPESRCQTSRKINKYLTHS